MSEHHENNANRHVSQLNPLMIQSYFDDELTSEEFEAISHDDLIHSPTYQALEELRQVVRTESELALDHIDGYALLDAINAQIDAELKTSHKPVPSAESVFAPKRRTTAQVFQRWAPAFIGAALFLMSIPGLIAMFTYDNHDEAKTPTVVLIDSNRTAQPAQAMVQYPQPAQVWYDNQPKQAEAVPTAETPNSQLTIEEMDFALRHIINRIENLENAHVNGLETGKKALFLNPLKSDSEVQDSQL